MLIHKYANSSNLFAYSQHTHAFADSYYNLSLHFVEIRAIMALES